MNILILSSSHPYKTAGAIAGDLCRNFNKKDNKAYLITNTYDSYDEPFIINYFNKFEYIFNRYYRNLKVLIAKKLFNHSIDPNYGGIPFKVTRSNIFINRIKRCLPFTPDAILLFFTTKFIFFKDIQKLYQYYQVPIFQFIPDMSPFTGACSYSWDCNKYTENCGYCPALKSKKQKDSSYKNIAAKIKYISEVEFYVITSSHWLLDRIKQSSVLKNKPYIKIPSNTTRQDFFTVNEKKRQSLRNKYNLPSDALIISFGSNNLNAKRKGIHHIIKVINSIPFAISKKYKLLFISAGNKQPIEEVRIDNYKHLGFLQWSELAELYQMSDAVISASIQDAGPATPIESILCGTPVISYDTGIAKEWIIHNQTGFLVNVNDINGLYSCILKFVETPKEKLNSMRNNCIALANKKKKEADFYTSISQAIKENIKNH